VENPKSSEEQMKSDSRKTLDEVSGTKLHKVGSSDRVPVSSLMSHTQAEAKYTKLMESKNFLEVAYLETLKTVVQAASNTKLDINSAIRSIRASLREFTSLAQKLCMVSNPDANEQRVKPLQQ